MFRLVMVVVLCVGAAGCGGIRAAAEPARSPAPSTPAAGRLTLVGALAEGVAVDPFTGEVAVGVRHPDGVVILDRRGRRLARVRLGAAPRHLLVQRPGGPLVIPSEGADRLVWVGLGPRLVGRILGSVALGRRPHDLAEAGGRLFVGDELGDRVSVLEGNRVVGTVPVARQPGGLASVGRQVAVVSVGARRLSLLDPETLEVKASVACGEGPSHVVALGSRLYVADTAGGTLLVYETVPRLALVRRIPLAGSPYGLAVDPARARLWVTLTARNRVVGLDLTMRGRAPVSLPTVGQPNSVAVDPGSGALYVVGAAAGVLETITSPGA